MISENLKEVRERMSRACRLANRPESEVHLIAVSKTKPIERVRAAFEAGQTVFGENYAQEALSKATKMPEAEWHFIGSIQSNKAKLLVGKFELIHSVERLKVARVISQAAVELKVVQDVLLQLHIGHEETKSGFELGELLELWSELLALPGIRIRGLMALPPLSDDTVVQRQNFSEVRTALARLKALSPALTAANLNLLSMGTTHDFESAIAEGATHVRVGTAIFGAREAQSP